MRPPKYSWFLLAFAHLLWAWRPSPHPETFSLHCPCHSLFTVSPEGLDLYKWHSLEARSACYRGPKPQKYPMLLGEGAKGVLVHVDQKPLALVQERVALVQNRVTLVQDTLGRPSLQLVNHLLHPLLTTLGTFESRTLVAGTPGLKHSQGCMKLCTLTFCW